MFRSGISTRKSEDYDYITSRERSNMSNIDHSISLDKIYNINRCNNLFTIGRHYGHGTSTTSFVKDDESQKLVDIESILLNRNFKNQKMNPVNPTKFNLTHYPECKNPSRTSYTRLSSTPLSEVEINRFLPVINDIPPLDIEESLKPINTSLLMRDNQKLDLGEKWNSPDFPPLNNNNTKKESCYCITYY